MPIKQLPGIQSPPVVEACEKCYELEERILMLEEIIAREQMTRFVTVLSLIAKKGGYEEPKHPDRNIIL